MKAGDLFRKTLPFCWAKLILGGALVLVLGILLAMFVGIGALISEVGAVIGFLLWIPCIGAVNFIIMHYFGYLLKAGHVAVLAEAAAGGKVPENQVQFGMDKVKSRFATANIYFAVDKLVSGAVKQIQKGIEKIGNALSFIPGMDHLENLLQFFVSLSLGYVDECCLGYTFYKADQGAFQSACDGVVIYAKNIKALLKNAAMTMLKVILITLVAAIVIFIPVLLIFNAFGWNILLAIVVACLIAWAFKFALLDSYILCQTMAGYMKLAPSTEITFDLYGKLCNISSSFRELFNKGKKEAPRPASANAAPVPAASIPENTGSRFCGNCGARVEAGSGFCGSCGAKM